MNDPHPYGGSMRSVDLPDQMIDEVGDVDVAGGVDSHPGTGC
jgi:hypothetical protein